MKISFIPLSRLFTVAHYTYSHFPTRVNFPILAAFSLFQISQNKFKFKLSVKLNMLFSMFHIQFPVSDNVNIVAVSIPTVECSKRSKIEISQDGKIVWTLKTPATYSEGEGVEGVIEINKPLAETDQVAKYAKCSFSMSGKNLSQVQIDKKLVSVFPNNNKTNISMGYELVSDGNSCTIVNSSIENPKELGNNEIDFTDCVSV